MKRLLYILSFALLILNFTASGDNESGLLAGAASGKLRVEQVQEYIPHRYGPVTEVLVRQAK